MYLCTCKYFLFGRHPLVQLQPSVSRKPKGECLPMCTAPCSSGSARHRCLPCTMSHGLCHTKGQLPLHADSLGFKAFCSEGEIEMLYRNMVADTLSCMVLSAQHNKEAKTVLYLLLTHMTWIGYGPDAEEILLFSIFRLRFRKGRGRLGVSHIQSSFACSGHVPLLHAASAHSFQTCLSEPVSTNDSSCTQ